MPEFDAYERYLVAEQALNEGLIRTGLPRRAPAELAAHQRVRLAEMRQFLAACGDPQRAYPAVHVTGTSGKGSVATAIAAGLQAAGLRVGLHISPYLQSQTEKICIAGQLLDGATFAELVATITPLARTLRRPETHASPHGMASVTVALEAFRRAEVDVAVVEAGCGGRFDLTNVLQTTLAVITSVGHDHLASLGPTLRDVAWHKVGIFRRGVPAVVSLAGDALATAEAEAAALDVPLQVLPPDERPFPERNQALARAALAGVLPRLGLPAATLRRPSVEAAIRNARQPARLEVVPGSPAVCLDGAHNPDKMQALLRALEAHPAGRLRPRVALVGVLALKDGESIAAPLASTADAVVLTEPRVFEKPARPAASLAPCCAGRSVHVCPDPDAAFDRALQLAGPAGLVVVTGSLYLVGALRERFYPKREVVLQRTSWPTRPAHPAV